MPSIHDLKLKFQDLPRPITIVNRSRSATNELRARILP